MKILDPDLLISQGINPPPFYAFPWVRAKSLTLISAEPFTGKSALITGLAGALSRQAPFMGEPTSHRKPLFLALDGPQWDYLLLYRKVLLGAGLKIAPGERTAPLNHVGLVTHRVDLLSKQNALESLLDACRLEGELPNGEYYVSPRPRLLFIDALRNIHSGDEDSSREMGAIMNTLRKIVEEGTAVVVTHHVSKGRGATGYAARGSSVIAASPDIHIHLKAEEQTDTSTKVKATWVKGRGGDCPRSLTYSMTWDDERLVFSKGARAWVPQPGESYTWNDLAQQLKLAGDKLPAKLTELGLKRGTDGNWRLSK